MAFTAALKRIGVWLPLIALAIGFFTFRQHLPTCGSLQNLLQGAGQGSQWQASLIYLGLSTFAMIVLIPRTFFVILAGVCFGIYQGTFLVMIASLGAAFIAFFIARYAARARFESLLTKRKWFYHFELAAAESGISFVILARALTVIHFGLSNYAFGLLPIPLSHYMIGTVLGLMPGSIALVYGGNVFGCALLEGDFDLPPIIRERLIIATVLLSLSAILPLIWHKRQQRRKATKETPTLESNNRGVDS